MFRISRRELEKVSYLELSGNGERAIPLQPYFDGTEWHQWLPFDQNTLIRAQTVDFCEGLYFAKEPAHKPDGIFDLLQFVTKHALYEDVQPTATAIEHDVLNLCAAIWKVDFLFKLSASQPLGMARLVITDLEYILVTCRSLVDLMQRLISLLWRRVKILPAAGVRHRAELPKQSMADVVVKGDGLRSVEEIRERWSLPDEIANFYERVGPSVLALRAAREAIIHLPTRNPIIFTLDRGFAVDVDGEPFHSLGKWEDRELAPNRLGSLQKFIAQVVLRVLGVAEDMADTLRRSLTLPADIAPGLHVFLCSDYVGILQRLHAVAEGSWERFAEIDL